tara:strand:+ start:909 stop:1175 length:267 start_codon:yes stop_codon:yes gene_type:complete
MKMEINLQDSDRLRLHADFKKENFVNISKFGYDAMAIDLHTAFQYIEVRRKDGQVRMFSFKKKSDKKECDFGWWENAEVILAINEVNK